MQPRPCCETSRPSVPRALFSMILPWSRFASSNTSVSAVLSPESRSSREEERRPLDWPILMAVPKKKTSKARRDKRRAQHKIEAPRLNVCPQCGRPKRPHRVCPTCHTYRGRDVEPLRTSAP
ncbi:MAG: 50S ribosomal protein L32 [Gaiellaceae bacterium]